MTTIAAIITPLSPSAVGIVRLSGDSAFTVADRVFKGISHKKLSLLSGYRAAFGNVINADGTVLDEAVATVFRAPKSYTGENVCEISVHGGIFIVKKLLSLCLENGAVPAEPGEFTRRAFLNGKIDLAQAESIMEIIRSENEQSLRSAFSLKTGHTHAVLTSVRTALTETAGKLCASVDYPEEDIEELSREELDTQLSQAAEILRKLSEGYDNGRVFRAGIDTTIVGRTNSGKSTLMNYLCGCEKSIVTDREGTTRDAVSEHINLGNYVLNIFDTAGLRETDDEVEKIGVSISKRLLDSATLVICVFDLSRAPCAEDRELVTFCRNKKAIAVLNKEDAARYDYSEIISEFSHFVRVSAKNQIGKEEIINTISAVMGNSGFDENSVAVLNLRQRQCVLDAFNSTQEAIRELRDGVTLDMIEHTIESAVSAMMMLDGEKVSDAVVDEIFSHFCVGK